MLRRAKPRPVPDPPSEGPSPRDMDELRRQLIEQREKILRRIDGLGEQLRSLSENVSSELEEEAQETNSEHTLAHLSERDHAELAAIALALGRLVEGTYGSCVFCEEPIPLPRLRVLPTATTCVECAEREQRRRFIEAPIGEEPNAPVLES